MRRIRKRKTRKLSSSQPNFLHRFRFVILLFSVIVIVIILSQVDRQNNYNEIVWDEPREKSVREPVVSGTFYPGMKLQLDSVLDEYLDDAETREIGRVKALIVPHAGYIYSGPTAAYGFKQVEGKEYSDVFIIGLSHRVYMNDVSILNVTHYKTPLGEVALSSKAFRLLDENWFDSHPEAHAQEHSVEVEVPFIQKVLPDAKIIPMLLGDVDLDEVALTLEKYLDKDSLIVVSTDLSHYYAYETANDLDNFTINTILNYDFDSLKDCEACGLRGVMLLLKIAQKNGWEPVLLDYRNSGDTAGDKNSVVGYASIAFVSDEEEFDYNEVSDEDREFLLKLARETIKAGLDGRTPVIPDESQMSDILKSQRGCFVTLNKNHDLRGCIGTILPRSKLYECVMGNAMNAAFRDSRFTALKSDELDDVVIEISKLSVPEKLEYDSPEELLDKLQPNVHGVILTRGWQSSTYLPQVWEQIPDKNTFLMSLCQKGGMSWDCYMSKDITIETYRAEVWEES